MIYSDFIVCYVLFFCFLCCFENHHPFRSVHSIIFANTIVNPTSCLVHLYNFKKQQYKAPCVAFGKARGFIILWLGTHTIPITRHWLRSIILLSICLSFWAIARFTKNAIPFSIRLIIKIKSDTNAVPSTNDCDSN